MDGYITVRQAVERTGYSKSTIGKWVRDGDLPSIDKPRRMVPVEALDRLVSGKKTGPRPGQIRSKRGRLTCRMCQESLPASEFEVISCCRNCQAVRDSIPEGQAQLVYDPTNGFPAGFGLFERGTFIEELLLGSWPEGSIWRLGDNKRYRVTGGRLERTNDDRFHGVRKSLAQTELPDHQVRGQVYR